MFSIVMLTWNNYDKFKRCMKSLLHYLVNDNIYELIILDNGSSDPNLISYILKLEQNYKKIKIILNDKNLGVAGGREVLFKEASGDHILSFDSDVVILELDALCALYLKFMEDPNNYLLGGGGGNHVFFPSVDPKDVNNLTPSEKFNEIKFVDEVAGWFQGFPSKILTYNGGDIYMDTRFHPFWGEDTDFCYQIRLKNKKCGIVGKGLISHVWSSCSDDKVKKDMMPQWNKFLDKWNPTFKNLFNFPFDRKFYDDIYNENKLINSENLKDHYFNSGMYNGSISHKTAITNLFPEATFINNKTIEYNKQKYKTIEFVEKIMNIDTITREHFINIENKIKDTDNIYILYFDSLENNEKIIKKLDTKISIMFICTDKVKFKNTIDYIKLNFSSYIINIIYDYNNNDIPFMLALKYLEKYKFKIFMKINNNINLNSTLFNEDINSCKTLTIDSNDVSEEQTDRFNYVGIQKLITPEANSIFSKTGCYINHFDKYYPISKNFDIALENALRTPFKYDNLVNPRSSSKHLLNKYLAYTNYIKKSKPLLFYPFSINEERDIIDIRKNIEKFEKKCDVFLLNCGSLKNLKISDTNADYYHEVNDTVITLHLCLIVPQIIKNFKDYSNIIFYITDMNIDGNIQDFLEMAKSVNISIYRKSNKLSMELFSVINSYYDMFFSILFNVYKNKELENKELIINNNIQKNLRCQHIWNIMERNIDEESTEITYYKEREAHDADDEFIFSKLDES